MTQPYQQYYQQILMDPSVPSLLQGQSEDYGQSNYDSGKQIFPLCTQKDTPEFFKTNLLSPNRIIKYLNGEYCVYRAFYFQLFKLMFEIQNDDKDYLEMFKQIMFDPNIIQRNGQNSRAKKQNSRLKTNGAQQNQSDSSRLSEMSEQQAFKREFQTHQKCIAQFTQTVLQNKHNFSSFEHYLPYYPQIDQSMVLVLQTFIENANDSQEHQMDSIQSILEYLCEIFEIQLVVIENCFKFQESDVFLYIEQKQDDEVWVYIAFNQILDEDENDKDNPNQQQNSHPNQSQTINAYQTNQSFNGQPPQIQSLSYQQQVSSPSHVAYSSNIQNSYTSSSNQNPSIKDNRSLSQKDRQSSTYRDNVITSEMKAQQSNQKYFNNYSPDNHFIHNSPHQFKSQQGHASDNRPNRINSDIGVGQTELKPQNQNPLTKSNHLPGIHLNPQKKSNMADLHNNTSTSYVWNQNQTQSTNQIPPEISQSNGFMENSKKQGRNFHKKVRYFDEDSIIEENIPFNKQLKKMQSITETYREEVFQKEPEKDQGPFMKKNEHESSFQVMQSSSLRNTSDKRVTDSKAETIINMFGDMLGSCANINTFDGVQGSNSSIGNGFGSSSQQKMQAVQDHGNNPYIDSYSKQYMQVYGTSTYEVENKQVMMDGNKVNMKKTKSEQVIFQARPKGSGDVFSRVQIKETTIARNEHIHNSLRPQVDRSYTVNYQGHNEKLLMDSQELRINDRNGQIMSSNEHFPFRNMGLGQSANEQLNTLKRKQADRQSPQNSDKEYLDGIQARSYWGQDEKSNRNKSNPGSFHNSSRGSAKSQYLQNPSFQPPNIKVNSIRSESQTSSRQINKRNNYYRDEDFTQLDSNNQYSWSLNHKEPSVKSEDNTHIQRDSYRLADRQQFAKNPNIKLSQFAHEYKSQQYVRVAPIEQNQNYKATNHISRAYTSNNEQVNPKKALQTQNTQQQDDFFFHPSNKSSIKYGLKTIEEVRASKQTNKDSYKIGNAQKISYNEKVIQMGQDKLRKYELVNSITGLSQQIIGNTQEAVQDKGSSVLNRLLEANTFKFKESKQESKEMNDESVNNGTFYKQFTNSKVLKLLKQPYKTKVQILKNRFKGQHRTSINKAII